MTEARQHPKILVSEQTDPKPLNKSEMHSFKRLSVHDTALVQSPVI